MLIYQCVKFLIVVGLILHQLLGSTIFDVVFRICHACSSCVFFYFSCESPSQNPGSVHSFGKTCICLSVR